jgi:hypothetical protein
MTAEIFSRDTMMEPMLSACPSFLPEWEAFLREWKGRPEGLPVYIALSDLARHLTGKLVSGDTGQFNDIFEVVELWHTRGDDYVREAASIGLLEDLQNGNLWPDRDAADWSLFELWLRPTSRRWWNKLIDHGQHGIPLTDD